MVTNKTDSSKSPPTEDKPEVGQISIGIGGNSFPLSKVEHWIEDGLHVIRSVEFDCYALGENEWETVKSFIRNAEEIFRFLRDLVGEGRATPDENNTFSLLSRCFHTYYNFYRRKMADTIGEK